jgi:hypothetical protein
VIKQEIRRINARIHLDLTTHFFAAFLANNCIAHLLNNKERVEERHAARIVQACVLLSAKMSERDIHIPTVSDISIAGGKPLKPKFDRKW